MLFRLISIDSQNQIREFSFWLNQLEQGFEALNILVANGVKLISIHLVDEGSIISLPIESFDGIPVLKRIEDLERVWKAILGKPTPTLKMALLNLINKRLAQCERLITRIDPLITRAESVLLRSRSVKFSHNNQLLETNYMHMLSFYQSQLDGARHNRQRLLKTIASLHQPYNSHP